MIISNQSLDRLPAGKAIVPEKKHLSLPEKVLQFGTGVLLRGLPDYFIDKANRNGSFNGRTVVVKSTGKGDVKAFEDQDCLYTICVRGIENGLRVEENILSSAISRVLQAGQDWPAVLEAGARAGLDLIISNTTEVGIRFNPEDIRQQPPVSFPAKLLAVLHHRYQVLGDTASAALAVIATELIPDNGKKLKDIVLQLVEYNNLNEDFNKWLEKRVLFCSSLVDRIVPGKPDGATLAGLEKELGYSDELLIVAEPYRLWAIEGGAEVSALLGLESADSGVIVRPDIEVYRELKVRLLNGTHSLACAIAYLSGIETVNQAMNNGALKSYITEVMRQEIIPAIPYQVDVQEALAFSKTVLDRFANPYIEHFWMSISLQYSMKMKIRIIPLLLQYYKVYNQVPVHIAFGFAAFLSFMKISRKDGDNYYGTQNGREYLITDDQVAYFYQKSQLEPAEYIAAVLCNTGLWGAALSGLPGFAAAVEENYRYISENGMTQALLQAGIALQAD